MMKVQMENMFDGTYHASVMTEVGSVFLGYVTKDTIFDGAEVDAYVARCVAERIG